jgi:protein required for attachment to host cells
MGVTWVIVADSSRARLFELGPHNGLSELQDFSKPEGREKNSELHSDVDGHFGGAMRTGTQAGTQAHTSEPQRMPAAQANDMFARQLANLLRQGLHQQRYSSLLLVAAPKFLGQLRPCLDTQVEKCITHGLPNNIASMPVQQLEAYLQQAVAKPAGAD